MPLCLQNLHRFIGEKDRTMTALILLVFLGAAVIAIPIAHALLVAAMAAAATSGEQSP